MRSLREEWIAQADAWAAIARDPSWDHHFWLLNMPRFLELLPPPGLGVVDIGCGEGRLGRILSERGYRVTGVEQSAAVAELAREYHDVVVADAAALPFPDASFDLAIAFMALHDMDDMEGAVHEAARVLRRGGHFCIAIEHPISKAGAFDDPDDPESTFRIRGSYLDVRRVATKLERDGRALTLHSITRPLSSYIATLEDAGFGVEAFREPRPDDAHVARRPRVAKWRRIPVFAHIRACKA